MSDTSTPRELDAIADVVLNYKPETEDEGAAQARAKGQEKCEGGAVMYIIPLSLIERKARKLLDEHACLDEFVMGMGCWIFTRRGGRDDISTVYREDVPGYAVTFMRMMDEFDDLELGGNRGADAIYGQGPCG